MSAFLDRATRKTRTSPPSILDGTRRLSHAHVDAMAWHGGVSDLLPCVRFTSTVWNPEPRVTLHADCGICLKGGILPALLATPGVAASASVTAGKHVPMPAHARVWLEPFLPGIDNTGETTSWAVEATHVRSIARGGPAQPASSAGTKSKASI